jgi:1-acyl-sn-glycerol-3-phosphate acyltransferase
LTASGACGREPLVNAIAAFLAHTHAPAFPHVRRSLERTIDDAGPEALAFLGQRLERAGDDWTYYPGDPLVRRIHHLLADHVLTQQPIVFGADHLALVDDRPLVIMANHLSYADANVIDVLLQKAGAGALARRLTVLAGPKVYTNLARRFSSLCFGTIRTPQSSAVSSEEAAMAPRDVARAARQVIRVAEERLRLGEALLVFPEGSRSRSGGLQPLLHGCARYLDTPEICVLPIAITGSEELFPIGDPDPARSPSPLTLRIGHPVQVTELRRHTGSDRQLLMDVVGCAIAELLPAGYRGAYADGMPARVDARRICRAVFRRS